MNDLELTDTATRDAAWSGQVPEHLALFSAKDGTLTANSGVASIGRSAIAATARSFMESFPDMIFKMDSVSRESGRG
jgi:hypothetical protein